MDDIICAHLFPSIIIQLSVRVCIICSSTAKKCDTAQLVTALVCQLAF